MILRDWGVDDRGRRHFSFYCPACDCEHSVSTPAWTWNGSLEKPTFSPSLRIERFDYRTRAIVVCHLYVIDGQIRYQPGPPTSDCTHALAGRTVDMVPLRSK